MREELASVRAWPEGKTPGLDVKYKPEKFCQMQVPHPIHFQGEVRRVAECQASCYLLPPASSAPPPASRHCARSFTFSSHVILPKSPGKQTLTCLKMRNQTRPTERRQLPQCSQLDSNSGYHFLPWSLQESPEVGVLRGKQHLDDGSRLQKMD